MITRRRVVPASSRRSSRGVVLLISLIVLVAMTLGGIAIMRSVDTTTLIAGNLAFKQRALYASDNGVAQALTWLLANPTALNNDNATQGYYSSQAFDWTVSSAWASSGVKTIAVDAAGNTINYVIHRMCTLPNIPYNGAAGGVDNVCGVQNPTANAATKPAEGDSSTDNTVFAPPGALYFRVTVRASGPRNTQSYTQAMVTISL